ncbi:transposase [Aeromicrobium sp. YIM 150415]|nr:transposase [Aeromicrobium sp. YIM 150415]
MLRRAPTRAYLLPVTATAAICSWASSACPIPEIARLGRTLRQWWTLFLAYWDTGRASNGGAEAVNGLIELARRVAHGDAGAKTRSKCSPPGDLTSDTRGPTLTTGRLVSRPYLRLRFLFLRRVAGFRAGGRGADILSGGKSPTIARSISGSGIGIVPS